MTDTIREQIISAIVTRAAHIRTANGYITECGQHAFRVRKNLNEDAELPAVVVWPRPETIARDYGVDNHVMPVQIEGLAVYGAVNPSTITERIIGDLIECFSGTTWSAAFTSGGTAEISTGDTITGATSGSTAFVSGVTVTSGTWAGGDAAGTLMLRRKNGAFSAENIDVGTDLNVATIGAMTGQGAATLSTGGLAQEIRPIQAGTESYPEPGETVTGAVVVFDVSYITAAGDPYSQQ